MDDQLTQIPEGDYVLRFEFHETKRIFKSEKIYLHFRIMNMGQHFEKPITGYYNCSIIGKPGKDGRFKAGWKSNLMREIVGLTGQLPKRTDRLRLSPLKTMLVLGRVENVTKTSAQRDIPEPLRYSIVRQLLRVHTGTLP
jgi:hypothetical protein